MQLNCHRFNSLLSKERIVVEHAIGRLKRKFGCLMAAGLRVDTTFVPKMVTALCVLHNVNIYLTGPVQPIDFIPDDDESYESDDSDDASGTVPTPITTLGQLRAQGKARRDQLIRQLGI